jgi:tetratricopeptide (TPR) repeat protein
MNADTLASQRRDALVAIALGGVAVLAYWAGLRGGFVFDDFGNLVDDPRFASAALHAHFWAAVLGGHAGPFDRPLSMLSFALQMRLTGFDPWPLKFFNLLLHLANGVLIYALSTRVIAMAYRRRAEPGLLAPQSLALLVAAAWLLAPIQLTAVLYVVQREEALAAFIVLLGLLGYWHGRMRLIDGRAHAWRWIWGSLALGTLLATSAKETGVMLPAYAAVLEWVVLRGDGDAQSRLPWVYLVLLIIPGALGLAWLLPGVLDGAAYATRTFTLQQRLLTEGRVLVDYLHWILAPQPDALSLYHDDLIVSTGWLAPWMTAASWLLLAALFAGALALRRRLPLVSLGLLWFFVGQSLVSTFVPLELVYEHRNYLPSWGVFVAAFGLLAAWRPAQAQARSTLRTLVVTALLALIGMDALFTGIRAQVWSSPYRLAYFEATLHPRSPRAAYDLGRIELMMAQGRQSGLYGLGMQQMAYAAKLPGADLQPWQALIFMAAKQGERVDSTWWAGMRRVIDTTPMSAEDVGALYSLIHCGIDGVCHYDAGDLQQLGAVLALAAQRAPGRAELLTLEANYEANLLHRPPQAYALMQRAVALAPDDYAYWNNLVQMQLAGGLDAQAVAGIERMRELDRFGLHRAELAQLAQRAKAGASRTSTPPDAGESTVPVMRSATQ